MTEDKIIAQVQALYALVIGNYANDAWLVMPDVRGADRAAMTKTQILLSGVFGGTKAERIARMETLAAVMPVVRHNGRPIEYGSTKILLLAELYGLLAWLDQNGTALDVLATVRQNPVRWSLRIREHLGYIRRPAMPAPPLDDLPMFE